MPYSYIKNSQSGAKKDFLTGLFTLLALAVLLWSGLRESTVPSPDTEIEQSEQLESAVVLADANGVMFILRSVGGRVAVLNSFETAVLEVLDIPVSELPKPFADELEGGVIIGSITELVSVISQYQRFT